MSKRASVDVISSANELQNQHAELDRRVRELDRRAIRTPAELNELAALKKQKLILKDRIRDSTPPAEVN